MISCCKVFAGVFFVFFILVTTETAVAQYSQLAAHKPDSIPKYPYKFPIWGDKAAAKGFNIPYPAGIMVNTFIGKSSIEISNLQLGFENANHDIPLTPVELIEFGKNTATIKNINLRPDLYILPFWDLYGIFGYTEGKTSVSLTTPVAFNTTANLKGYTYGFGSTFAGGIGKYFVVGDFNWQWSKLDILDKPASSSIMSYRIGRSFPFKHNKESNVAFWAGAMRMKIGSKTEGKIKLEDVIPPEVWDRKDQFVQDYYDWYNSLGSSPGDLKKKEVADKVLTPIVESIDAKDGSGTVSYSLSKKPTHKWNMIVGGQYQVNKHWQFRTEIGFFGERTQGLLSVNYRFGW